MLDKFGGIVARLAVALIMLVDIVLLGTMLDLIVLAELMLDRAVLGRFALGM